MTAREWWQDDSDDLIDAERLRAAEILSACLRAGRPTLAVRWIASGVSLADVMTTLIVLMAAEHDGNFQTQGTVGDEFDESPHIFCGLDLSRVTYVDLRLREKARAAKCGG